MEITRKRARKLYEILEEERERIRKEGEETSRSALWEKKRKKVIERLEKLPELVKKAASQLSVECSKGRKSKLDPEQKTMLFLFARLNEKSNRDVEAILSFLGPAFGVKVSYKTIERLYSDEEVKLVLHNLFMLLLKEEGISGDCSGDGTGYSLEAGKHYCSDSKEKENSKSYRYVFRLVDLKTGMYIAYGYSDQSEKQAFQEALKFLKRENIPLESVRLDKYYSSKKDLRRLGKEVKAFVLPKKGLSSFGPEWYRVLNRVAMNPYKYLKEYFKRELSESYFGSDKERFGRKIRQRREDRRKTACFAIAVLHNLFSVRVGPI